MKNKPFKLFLILLLFFGLLLAYNHFKVEVDEEILKTESVILEKEKTIKEYVDNANKDVKDKKLVVVSHKKVKDTNCKVYTRYDLQIENARGTKSKMFSVYRKE
ncbi:hypothetical protein [Parvimonas micra]|uniref:hypothetical protein n=1 Tax=Parvimonas micra TaxID=33033 RepID=UPI0022B70057|nr:hypothetical protein [Parvimonas micra]WBB29005.1 hypothetical protein NM223_05010 [Parvimonas micra]